MLEGALDDPVVEADQQQHAVGDLAGQPMAFGPDAAMSTGCAGPFVYVSFPGVPWKVHGLAGPSAFTVVMHARISASVAGLRPYGRGGRVAGADHELHAVGASSSTVVIPAGSTRRRA